MLTSASSLSRVNPYAIAAGADMLNDVRALTRPGALAVAAAADGVDPEAELRRALSAWERQVREAERERQARHAAHLRRDREDGAQAVQEPGRVAAAQHALEYMDLKPGTKMKDIKVDAVFLGSCTNGRIEDLRAAAEILRGQRMAPGLRFLVVPGSAKVRLQAEAEGLDKIFKDFGAEWRFAGCSMCLGMNPDQLGVGERAASTSNRNFEGRQGKGARTHLVSPLVAAATAIRGTLSSPADLIEGAN